MAPPLLPSDQSMFSGSEIAILHGELTGATQRQKRAG